MENKIEKAEDVLAGVVVNWAEYEPPGGERWRELYTEGVAPVLEKARADAILEKKRIEDGVKAASKIRKLCADIARIAGELREEVDRGTLSRDIFMSEALSKVEGGAAFLGRAAKTEVEIRTEYGGTGDIDEDIRFFDAFQELVDADAELDRLLFALVNIDQKYRAKVFRAACRNLSVVERAREVVRHSKSVVLDGIRPQIAPLLSMIDKSYAVVSPVMRGIKKMVAKSGASVLAELADEVGRLKVG